MRTQEQQDPRWALIEARVADPQQRVLMRYLLEGLNRLEEIDFAEVEPVDIGTAVTCK